ncbi:MAG: class B sortase [Firmicutes bacterium]|nr:class B sortase [Bacillota bacterium]
MKTTLNLLRIVLIIFLLLVIAYSGFKIVNIFKDYHDVTVANEEAEEKYVSVNTDGIPVVDFEQLSAVNPDIVAWIYIPDTNVSFPVLRGSDNATYLHNDYRGLYSFAGSIFMDVNCSADFSDIETMIYGHNMHNGSMFGRLKKFEDEDYRKAHEEVYILLPDGHYIEYKAASGEYISIENDVYLLPKTGGDPETMVLSTCTDDSSDTIRFVLICKYEGKHKIKKNNN